MHDSDIDDVCTRWYCIEGVADGGVGASVIQISVLYDVIVGVLVGVGVIHDGGVVSIWRGGVKLIVNTYMYWGLQIKKQ